LDEKEPACRQTGIDGLIVVFLKANGGWGKHTGTIKKYLFYLGLF
jgi:hypothetical protein